MLPNTFPRLLDLRAITGSQHHRSVSCVSTSQWVTITVRPDGSQVDVTSNRTNGAYDDL